MLKELFGGIVTVLPNTATVESDFSRLLLEKNEYRKALTEFSLEGVLHSKRFAELTVLEWSPIMSPSFPTTSLGFCVLCFIDSCGFHWTEWVPKIRPK